MLKEVHSSWLEKANRKEMKESFREAKTRAPNVKKKGEVYQ